MPKKKVATETVAPSASKFDAKYLAVLFLLLVVAALAYYFLVASIPQKVFVPSSEINATAFLKLFSVSKEAFIVMDLRDAQNNIASNNVIQCGIDFASSNAFGDKNVTPLSLDKSTCVTPDGMVTYATCASMMKNSMVIYIRSGNDGVRYYSNGIIVPVGQSYKLGACAIKITSE